MAPAKRGRPRKDDPRHLQRQAEQLAMRIELQEVLEPGRIAKKSSGLPTGVSHTDTGKFQARIKLDGKRINLGSFDTAEDAAAAYRTAKASGFTCAESPKQNRVQRGTGLLAHVPRAALCTADLLRLLRFAGRKALIKKGLQPAFTNGLKPVVAYRNAYNLPTAGVLWPAPTPPACTQAAAPPLQLSWQPSWRPSVTLS
jgi:hypothetical protein